MPRWLHAAVWERCCCHRHPGGCCHPHGAALANCWAAVTLWAAAASCLRGRWSPHPLVAAANLTNQWQPLCYMHACTMQPVPPHMMMAYQQPSESFCHGATLKTPQMQTTTQLLSSTSQPCCCVAGHAAVQRWRPPKTGNHGVQSFTEQPRATAWPCWVA